MTEERREVGLIENEADVYLGRPDALYAELLDAMRDELTYQMDTEIFFGAPRYLAANTARRVGEAES